MVPSDWLQWSCDLQHPIIVLYFSLALHSNAMLTFVNDIVFIEILSPVWKRKSF